MAPSVIKRKDYLLFIIRRNGKGNSKSLKSFEDLKCSQRNRELKLKIILDISL